jgi:Outer membrane protein beta-barrel domain
MKYTFNLWITGIVLLTTTALRANDLTAFIGAEPIDTVKKDTLNIKMGSTTFLIITDEESDDTLKLDGKLEPKKEHAEDYSWCGIDGFQIGAIGLFSKEGSRAFGDRPDLKLNTSRCSMLGFTPFSKEAEIISDRLRIAAGLGFQFESYAFDSNIRLTDEKGLQGIEDTVRDYRKNTLNANYVTLPVVLQFNTKRNLEKSFHIAVGAIAGYRVGSNMTYKWSEEGRRQRERRRDDYALEAYRLSAIAQVGIGSAMIWAQYDMTMKFTAQEAHLMNAELGAKYTPEVYAWSAGINIPF